MNSLALFTIALASLVSSAVTETLIPGPRPTIGPVIPDQCICPGKVLCCKEVVDSSTRLGHYYLGQLGVEISGTSVPVGISCKPYDRFTVSNELCGVT